MVNGRVKPLKMLIASSMTTMFAGQLIRGGSATTGGEKGIDIARRSSLVLEEIEKTYTTGNVLVVSHKATTQIMLCSLLGIDVGHFRDRISMPVASVGVVEIETHRPLLHMMGDRSHLRGSMRSRAVT